MHTKQQASHSNRISALAGRHQHLLPIAGYVLLSLAVLWPILPHFSEAVPGGPVAAIDSWQNIWNLWWFNQALAAGSNPYHSPYLYHPHGVDLYLQTLSASTCLLTAPITALFGPIAGYNAAVLLALLLTGIGGYALALRISGHRTAAFIAGLILTFSPFHLTKIWDGQLELIAMQWLPFYALFLLRAAEDGRRRDALLAGGFLALLGYTSWYYFFFFAIYSLLFVALWFTAGPSGHRRTLLLQMLIVAGVGLLLLAPLLVPALRRFSELPESTEATKRLNLIALHSADVFDFFMPSYLHPVWGSAAWDWARPWHPRVGGWNIALGYTTSGLALLAAVATWRRAWRWWALTLASLLLALGPVLHVAGRTIDLPLPYDVLFRIPGAGVARRPSHFVIIAVLLLAPLAALGLRWLLERLPQRKGELALLVVLALLTLEYAPPRWPLLRSAVHPYYETIADQPGALVDLPTRNELSEPLQAQMTHRKPILGGYVSRTPLYPFVDYTPGVRQLWSMRPAEQPPFIPLPAGALTTLNYYNISTIMVHWSEVRPQDRQALEAAIEQVLPGVAPTYANDELSAYAVPPVQPQPFAFLSAGWYEQEYNSERRWHWMHGRGEITLVNPSDSPRPVTLWMQIQSYQEPRELRVALDHRKLGSWQILPDVQSLSLRLLLPPGEHRLHLEAPATPEQGTDRVLSINLLGAQLWPH